MATKPKKKGGKYSSIPGAGKFSKAKLDQTIFEFKNKQPITFKTNKGKSESRKEAYKRIQGENTKAFKGMIDEAFKKGRDKNANGGRIGRKFGTPNPRKTNVQKIKETFGPKKKLSPKQMQIAKLAGNPNKIDGADFKKLQQKRS